MEINYLCKSYGNNLIFAVRHLLTCAVRFLDGHSLGGGQNVSEFAPFVGMEQFFLPPALDNRLGGQTAVEQNQGAIGGFDPNLLAEEIWW